MNTPRSVSQYLAQLKQALAGAPQGLAADALADCQEHLQGALAANPGKPEAEVLAEAIASYGSPEDVAAEYLRNETDLRGPFPRPPQAVATERTQPLAYLTDPATYGALLYMLLSLATGIFYFVWVVCGLSLTMGFLALIVGIPFFLLFVGSVRLLSHMEGRIVESLLGVRMPRRLPPASQENFWTRVKDALTDLRTWSSLAYMLLMLPLGVLYFVLAAVGLSVSGGLILGGAAGISGHLQMEDHLVGVPPWVLSASHSPLAGLASIVLGIVLFFLVLLLARLVGRLHGRLAEALLVQF